jgi:hypothetical protein
LQEVVGGHPEGQLGDEAEEIYSWKKNGKKNGFIRGLRLRLELRLMVWVSCWRMGGVVLKLEASFLAYLKHSLGVRKLEF